MEWYLQSATGKITVNLKFRIKLEWGRYRDIFKWTTDILPLRILMKKLRKEEVRGTK